MSERKARSANFSNEEKVALLSIVSKYKGVIENKKTDNISMREQNKAWEKVEAEFNAISPNSCYRESVVLKKFYENKKKEARKFAADEKYQIRCTGGGLPPKVKKDPSYDLVLSLINDKTVYGLTNPFDSDFKKNKKTEINPQNGIEYELINEDATEESGKELGGSAKDLLLKEDEIIYHNEEMTHDQHVLAVMPQNNLSITRMEIIDEDPIIVELPEKDHVPANDKSKENVGKKHTGGVLTFKSPSITPAKNSNKFNQNDCENTPITLHNLSATPCGEKGKQSTKRKRPATVVRALNSSNIAQKYDELIDKRLRIADLMQVEYEQKTAEHLKRIELLELEIAIKKQQLNL